jgi:hypothetical protein
MVETQFTMVPGSTGAFGFQGLGTNSVQMTFSLKNLYINFGASVGVVQMPNYTDFTSLFEQYRITNVELQLFFNRNSDSTATGGATLPLVAFVKDYVNATPLTALSDALQYQNVELKQFGNTRGESPAVKLSLKPRVAVEVNDYGVFPAAVAAENQWYDSHYPDLPFYAVKGWYDNQTVGAGGASVGTVSLYAKVTYEFRRPY